MNDQNTQQKWDRLAPAFDLMAAHGTEKRWWPYKKALFSHMQGDILFAAVGTGLDIAQFPNNQRITAIDISPNMIRRAQPHAEQYQGQLELQVMDVTELTFDDNRFDQIFTSCTFCSVPDPVKGLCELKRVLKPQGLLYMFEHTGSRYFPFNVMLNIMTPLLRHWGPDMNRKTVAHAITAGFSLQSVTHHYLDIVKSIIAQKPV